MTRLSRRDWLKLSAATSLAAGLGGCATAGRGAGFGGDAEAALHTLASAKGLRFGSAMAARQIEDPQYRDIILRECSTIVPENELKWYTIFAEPGLENFGPADALANFAKDNGLTMRGHTLLWHRSEWSPGWVNELEFSSAAETEKFLEPRLAKVASRYHPFIYSWDVVNEAISDETGEFRTTSLSKKMGDHLIDFCFDVAKQNAPDARLVYNDFMSWETTSTAHRKGVLKFLERLLSRGVPIDGLGMQSHSNYEMPDEYTADKQREWVSFCDEVVDMGLELYITEFDVNDTRLPPDIVYRDKIISDYTRRYFDLMLQYSQLKEVLAWGMVDDQNWLQGFLPREDGVLKRPTIYDENYKAKSMRSALAQAFRAAPPRPPILARS